MNVDDKMRLLNPRDVAHWKSRNHGTSHPLPNTEITAHFRLVCPLVHRKHRSTQTFLPLRYVALPSLLHPDTLPFVAHSRPPMLEWEPQLPPLTSTYHHVSSVPDPVAVEPDSQVGGAEPPDSAPRTSWYLCWRSWRPACTRDTWHRNLASGGL